jgi:hypothetical protein
MKRCFVLVAFYLTLIIAKPAQANEDEMNLTNLGSEFLKYWAEVKRLHVKPDELEKHAALFKEHVIKDQTQFYLDVVFDKRDKSKKFDDILREALNESVPIFATYEIKIAANIKAFDYDAREQLKRLQKAIPGFNADLPIYGMVSLNKFAGGVRLNNGQQVLAMSFDKVAAIDRDFEMLFSHEVFHVYHNQENPGLRAELGKSSDLLIAGMFIEGIATFAEGDLNPTKKSNRMVKGLMAWCDKKEYKKFVGEFLRDNAQVSALTYEANKHLYRKWFYTSRDKDYKFPTEAAYCIGDQVVEALAAKHSLKEMVTWNVAKINSEGKKILESWK